MNFDKNGEKSNEEEKAEKDAISPIHPIILDRNFELLKTRQNSKGFEPTVKITRQQATWVYDATVATSVILFIFIASVLLAFVIHGTDAEWNVGVDTVTETKYAVAEINDYIWNIPTPFQQAFGELLKNCFP